MTGQVFVTISGSFMVTARAAYIKCIQDRVSGKVIITEDNNYSDHSLTVYIMVITALEAWINEVCLSPTSKMLNKITVPIDMLDDLEIKRKYYLIPQILWGRTFNLGEKPYQDFEMLVSLRNALVHYKMKSLDTTNPPKYFKYLRDKNLLISTGKTEVDYVWLHQLSNSKAALWAYNTACRMANGLIDYADDNTKTFRSGLLGNFEEIPENYWETIISKRSKQETSSTS